MPTAAWKSLPELEELALEELKRRAAALGLWRVGAQAAATATSKAPVWPGLAARTVSAGARGAAAALMAAELVPGALERGTRALGKAVPALGRSVKGAILSAAPAAAAAAATPGLYPSPLSALTLVLAGIGVDRFASRVERAIAAAAAAPRCQQINSAAINTTTPVSVASAVLHHDIESSGTASPGSMLGAVLLGMLLMLVLLAVPLTALVLRQHERQLAQRCRLATTEAMVQLAAWAAGKPDAPKDAPAGKQEAPHPRIDEAAAATTTPPDDAAAFEWMSAQEEREEQEEPKEQGEQEEQEELKGAVPPVPHELPIPSRRTYRDLRGRARTTADAVTAQAEPALQQPPASKPTTPVRGRRSLVFDDERPVPRMLDVYEDAAESILSGPRRRLRRGYEEVRRGQLVARRKEGDLASPEDAPPPPKHSSPHDTFPADASPTNAGPADASPTDTSTADTCPAGASPADATPPKGDAAKAKEAMAAFVKDMSSWLDFSSWQSPPAPRRETSGAAEPEATGSNVVSPAQPTSTTTNTTEAPRKGPYRGRARLPARTFTTAPSLDF